MGEAVDGKTALALADELAPDLLFLDVRLPELSGLEVARRLRHPAEIVFTTAYDRFAVAAFEIGALDYLVKPFGRERFDAALRAGPASALRGDAVPAGDRARSSLSPGALCAPLRAPRRPDRADRGGRHPADPGAGRLRRGPRGGGRRTSST